MAFWTVGEDVPRYENPIFGSDYYGVGGRAMGYYGAKSIDGIICYPYGVVVDREKAARIQAYVDYSYGEGSEPAPRSDMAELYGDLYVQAFARLERAGQNRHEIVFHHGFSAPAELPNKT